MSSRPPLFVIPAPEPGSIFNPPHPLSALLSQNAVIKVIPSWVGFFDQRDLPFTPPPLELFFVGDGLFHRVGLIEPDQSRHVVLRGEPFNEFFTVFMDAPHQVVGDADIHRAVALAGEDVDKVRHTQA